MTDHVHWDVMHGQNNVYQVIPLPIPNLRRNPNPNPNCNSNSRCAMPKLKPDTVLDPDFEPRPSLIETSL